MEYFSAALDSDVEKAVRQGIAVLQNLGARVVDISLPHTEYCVAVYYLIAPAEANSNLARFDGVRYGYRDPEAVELPELYSRSRAGAFGDKVKRHMEDMFSGVVNGNPDVSNWDTSSVTDMQSMFFRTEKANPDVSKWNISNVTNMYEMFQEAKTANPEVSNWDISKVENMSRMFYFASNATPNVKNWNTPNVTDMSGMFKGAEKANPDVLNWDISNVTDMKDMFSGSGIKKADLSKWKLNKDGSNGTLQSGHMFDGCEALEYLKTPAGLGTIVKGGNYDFKIIRLKKGDPVTIEKENQNFGGMESAYVINAADDKEAVYHVYRKDKYVGVTFDKNGGDTECWFNHEIVEKGKAFNAGDGRF